MDLLNTVTHTHTETHALFLNLRQHVLHSQNKQSGSVRHIKHQSSVYIHAVAKQLIQHP